MKRIGTIEKCERKETIKDMIWWKAGKKEIIYHRFRRIRKRKTNKSTFERKTQWVIEC